MRDIISQSKWRYNFYTRKLMNINLPKKKVLQQNESSQLNGGGSNKKRNEAKEIEYSYYDLLKNLF